MIRRADRNEACVLPPEKLRELWGDPLLRYSSVLQGLFSESVVICEADADCRFYEAMSEAGAGPEGAPGPSAHFTATGGKDRMPTAVRALRALGVPTRAVVDLDVLQDGAYLEKLVGAAGGEWSELRGNWQAVQKAAEQAPLVSRVPVEELQKALSANKERYVSADTMRRVRDLLPGDSPWAAVKKAGLRAFPAGQTQANVRSLIDGLRRLGIFVVEVGELEGFVPTVGNHGPRWLAEVMTRDLGSDPELHEAREFAKALISSL